MPKSPKIYTAAKNMINAVMVDLATNHGFSSKEASWKTTTVEEQLVVFETSVRIKELFEKELLYVGEEFATFDTNKDGSWKIIIADAGAESYFFARVLYIALARLESGVVDIETRNCNIIEHYVVSAAIREKISPLSFNVKAKYAKGTYQVTFPVNKMMTTFANKNVDILCRGIDQQLRGFFRPTV